MLTYTSPKGRRQDPLDFDFRMIAKAANSLLGKSKADALLKDWGAKNTLVCLGALEQAAYEVLTKKSLSLPSDGPKSGSEDQRRAQRFQIAREVAEWRQLGRAQRLSDQLPIRIRGRNQYRATFLSELVPPSTEEGKYTVRVSLQELGAVISSAEKSGKAKITLETDAETAKVLQDRPAQLVFQDELYERPEVKRIWAGNPLERAKVLVAGTKTKVKDMLASFASRFSGRPVALAKDCVISSVTSKPLKNGRVSVELEVSIPEIIKTIEGTGGSSETQEPGKGMITDGVLRVHCAKAYGCNGRDFARASSEIALSLQKNLMETTKQWFDTPVVRRKNIEDFLKEYEVLSLTLKRRPLPKSDLEPARSKISSSSELVAGGFGPYGGVVEISGPERIYSLEIVNDNAPKDPKSCPGAAGKEFQDALVKKEMERRTDPDSEKKYKADLEKILDIEDIETKQGLIEANFLKTNFKNIAPLDGGPSSVQLETYVLTPSQREEFQEEAERDNQNIFDAKGDPAEEAWDFRDWIVNKGTVLLNLPTEGAVLKRLTRYLPITSRGRRFLNQSSSKEKSTKPSAKYVSATRAERYDPETSMPGKDVLASSKLDLEKTLRLEDICSLSVMAQIREFDTQAANGAMSSEIRKIAAIRKTLAEWQTSLRRISPLARNPLEARVASWLETLSKEEGSEEKIQTLEELFTLFSPTILAIGKTEFGLDRTSDFLGLPVRSSALPLKLLCGTGLEELSDIKSDFASLWDMALRWQCAEAIAEGATAPAPTSKEEIVTQESKLLENLETALEAGKESNLLLHAISMEVATPPNYLYKYLNEIGLPKGLGSLDRDAQDFGDLILPLTQSPETMMVRGEETLISEVLEILEKGGVSVKLDAEDQQQISNAPQKALENWTKQCQKTVQLLEGLRRPTGQDASLTLILEAAAPTSEADAFDVVIAALHETLPQNRVETEQIVETLLTHNPSHLTVTTLKGALELNRGSGGQWVPADDSPEGPAAAAKINEVEAKLLSEPDKRSLEDNETITSATEQARRNCVMHRIGEVKTALNNLPPHLANIARIRNDILQPLLVKAESIERAKKAHALAKDILSSWKDSNLEDSSEAWGWNQEYDLNPVTTIEALCEKITGGPRGSNPDDLQEKYRHYVLKLFSQEDKARASEILATQGKKEAAEFLQGTLARSMEWIKEDATTTLPAQIQKLEDTVNDIVQRSQGPEGQELLAPSSPIRKLLEDKTKYRIYEQKISAIVKKVSPAEKAKRNHDQKPETNPIRALFQGRGARAKTQLSLDESTRKAGTNKVWVAGWLKTKEAQRSIAQRLNTASWVKQAGVPAKTAIAFLEFCRHRNLYSLPRAVARGGLSPETIKIINEGARHFETSLKELGIDSKTSSYRTQLYAGYALSQYSEAKYHASSPWKDEWEKPLEAVRAQEEVSKQAPIGIDPVFDKNCGLYVQIPSAYHAQTEDQSQDIGDIKVASEKVKVRSALSAVGALYREIGR